MSKRNLIRLFVGLLIVSLLAAPLISACSQPAPTQAPKPAASPTTSPAAAPKPSPTPSAAPIVLKAVDGWKPDYFVTLKFREMADQINKKAAGQMEIKYVGGPEVIAANDQMTACGAGTIDMFVSAHVYYSGLVPESAILGLPVVVWDFNNAAKLLMALKDDLDKIYQEKAKVKYMMTLSPMKMGIFTSKKPVASVDDMKGLLIRTMGGWDAAALKSLGAAPTNVASTEIYTAAQRGTIDGGSRPITAIEEWKEQEVWKNMTTTPIGFLLGGNWWINLATYNKLPPNLQKLLDDTAAEQQPLMVKYFDGEDQARIKRLAGFGVNMVDLKSGEADKWNNTLAAAANNYFMGVAPARGQALIDKLKAAAAK